MKFSKEFLQAKTLGGAVHEVITSHTRWNVGYQIIFEHEGKFYQSNYRKGATEYQDEEPYEYDEDMIECPEVRKVEKLVEVWEPV